MDRPLFEPHWRHAARVIVAACCILVWLGGHVYFCEYLPEKFGQEPRAGVRGRVESFGTALYTPAVWLDRMLGAWLDEPADGQRLFVLCFAQVFPLLALVVGGWPRAAVWRECLVVYAMIWVCLAVAGYIQLRGGITVFDS